jgi:hypothetical protein
VRRFALLLLALTVGSFLFGGYVWIGRFTWPGYFPALTAHVWLGVAVIVGSSPALAWHLRQTGSKLVPTLLVPAAILAVVSAVMPGRPEYPAFGPIGWAAGTSAAQLLLTAGFMKAMKHPGVSVKTSKSGIALTLGLLFALHLGVLGWQLRGDERWGPMLAHSAVGLGVGLLFAVHLKRVREIRWWKSAPVALLLLGGCGAAWYGTYPHDLVLGDFRSPLEVGDASGLTAPERDTGRPRVTLPANAEERRAARPKLDPAVLGNSMSCGNSGCHENITKQWAGSAHRFASDNAFYRAAVGRFVQERGPDDAGFCANCHDPIAVLAGTVVDDYADGEPPPSDGVSCVVCHATVHVERDATNGVFTVREPETYPGGSEAARDRNIRLDPRAHRQGLVGNFRINDPSFSCEACHRVVISPDVGAATTAELQSAHDESRYPGKLMCTDCHMPTLTINRSFEQPVYNHYMSGVNLDLPTYAVGGDPEALAFVQQHTVDWLAGSIETDPFTESDVEYGLPRQTVELMKRGGAVAVRVDTQRIADNRVRAIVTTTNHRAGHAYPIGPLDLHEHWLRIVVTNGAGDVIFEQGQLDADGLIDPDAARLGGVEIGRDGNPIAMHRVWDVAKIVGERKIPPRQSVEDSVEFDLPDGNAGPWTVSATWMFRRAPPEFVRWALGEDAELMPAHEFGSAQAVLN